MSFVSPPPSACWRHQGLRAGFEVTYFSVEAHTVRIDGTTTGFQDGATWIVAYSLLLDESWCTRSARLKSRTASGVTERSVASDGRGRWFVDGAAAPELDGCLDVDLESSAMTNALPVRRLGLPVGGQAAAPAAYVRAGTIKVERLEKSYIRADDQNACQQFDYEGPAFDFKCRLVYDNGGLVLQYSGIAVRYA